MFTSRNLPALGKVPASSREGPGKARRVPAPPLLQTCRALEEESGLAGFLSLRKGRTGMSSWKGQKRATARAGLWGRMWKSLLQQ